MMGESKQLGAFAQDGASASSRVHGGDALAMGLNVSHRDRSPLDFSVNVNPLGPSPAALVAAHEALQQVDAYPDRGCCNLRCALGEHYDVDLAAIVCGNGASDLVWRLAAATRPAQVLVCAPTFSEYAEAARFHGAQVREFALDAAHDFDVPAAFVAAVAPETDIVFICNPNNPTGGLVDQAVLDAVAQRCEEVGALLVIDECFLGFDARAARLSFVRRAAQSQNVLVLNAFTKTYGLAGLRLGYVVTGNERLRSSLTAAGQAWPVSSVAQAAGIAALGDAEYLRHACQLVEAERSWLSRELAARGFACVPSSANYLLFRSGDEGLPQRLLEQGVLVRPCASFSGLDSHWTRIAVRTHPENLQLIAALDSCREV